MSIRRKHRDQMDTAEIEYAEFIVHNHYKEWYMSHHALDRLKEKNVPVLKLIGTLQGGYVVEVSQNRLASVCVLMKRDYPAGAVCAVVSLPTFELVTVWANKPGQMHDTSQSREFEWDCNVVDVLQLALAVGVPKKSSYAGQRTNL